MKALPLLVLFACLAEAAEPAGKQPAPNLEQELMREKLVHSQNVLAGLTSENFELIEKNAAKLAAIADHAAMKTSQRPDYIEQTLVFQKNVTNLTRAAKARNLRAATDAYLAVTRNCINCHQFLRGNKVAILEQ